MPVSLLGWIHNPKEGTGLFFRQGHLAQGLKPGRVEREVSIFQQFHLDEPWDSPHNHELLQKRPEVYAPPNELKTGEPYSTLFQLFNGPGALCNNQLEVRKVFFFETGKPVFAREAPVKLSGILPDQLSSRVLMAEGDHAVTWTKPADLSFLSKESLPKLKLYGRPYGTMHVLFADWTARKLPYTSVEDLFGR